MRAAHAAEMCQFRAFLRKGFIMKLARGDRIEAQIELVLPPEFESRLAQRVVAITGRGMAFGEIRGMSCDFVCDDAVFDVFFVRQAKMLFRRHVAEHSGPVPTD